MPDLSFRTAAKFWVALVGLVASTVVASSPEMPAWVSVLAVVCTATATYLVPNAPVDGGDDG